MVRTRFAPSPTGFLHLGNVRSALFPWAFARHHRGVFILRIEDTDAERSTPEATQAIVDAMQWLGLDYDEGPYYQMQRMDRYREVLDDLLARGLAYRCYTTPAELEALRAEQMARGEKPRYDGRWRPEKAKGKTPPAGVAPVYRFRNPDDGVVAWDDAVKGRIEIANRELDDLVIARSAFTPTNNFCAVVGDKLSKRHGARGVLQYRDDGYLPEAVVNYLARLGWSHGDAEVFGVDEFVAWFDLSGLTPSPARFDPEKLAWLNHEHIKRLPDDELGRRLAPFLAAEGLDVAAGPPPATVAGLLKERTATLTEMADAAHYFYASSDHLYASSTAMSAMLAERLTPQVRPALQALYDRLATTEWTRASITQAIRDVATAHALKPGQVMMPLRALVTGQPQTPPIDAVLELVGRDATRDRMARGLKPAASAL